MESLFTISEQCDLELCCNINMKQSVEYIKIKNSTQHIIYSDISINQWSKWQLIYSSVFTWWKRFILTFIMIYFLEIFIRVLVLLNNISHYYRLTSCLEGCTVCPFWYSFRHVARYYGRKLKGCLILYANSTWVLELRYRCQ